MAEEMLPYPNKVESLFLKELFVGLKKDGIEYCVLRNYAHLPDSMGGGDLDLAVLPEQVELAGECILTIAEKYGATLLMDYNSSGRMMRFLGCYLGQWWGAAVDLFWAMEYKGVPYLDVSCLIRNSKTYKKIQVADDVDAAVTALIKELLANGANRKEYFEEVVAAYNTDSNRVTAILGDMFGPTAVASLTKTIETPVSGQPNLTRCVRLLRRDVLGKAWLSKVPLRLSNLYRRLRRTVRPPGRIIVVTGTDGSGKTTLIEAITPILLEATHGQVEYKHLRPGLIPSLRSVVTGKSSEVAGPVTRPHDKEPSGLMMSLFRSVYYAIDYYVGYWLKIYPSTVKRAYIGIFDRYYYDFLIDPRRMRINQPQWLTAMIFRLAPQPSLILCLGGDAEKIYQRKPETSLVEVQRQVCNLRDFSMRNDRAVWVDTTQSISNSMNQALTAIQRTKPWYVR